MGYHSHMLNPVERGYDIHDQELLAIMRGLCQWQHLLLSSPFMMTVGGMCSALVLSRALSSRGEAKNQLALLSTRTRAMCYYSSCDAIQCPLLAYCPPADRLACDPCSTIITNYVNLQYYRQLQKINRHVMHYLANLADY
jgi:RNase H-like domain found in reverse transcriptase